MKTIKYILLCCVALTITGLFIWDVFTPTPDRVDDRVIVPDQALVTSGAGVNIDVTIVNPGTNRIVYVYFWAYGRMAGRVLDEASRKGQVYRLRYSLMPAHVQIADGTFAVDFERDMRSGPVTLGVAFENSGTKDGRVVFENRHDLWISNRDISVSAQRRGWRCSGGEWAEACVDDEFFEDRIEAWEDDALKSTSLYLGLRTVVHSMDLQTRFARVSPLLLASAIRLLPVHDEHEYTDDVKHASKTFLMTLRIPSSQSRLTPPERYRLVRREIERALKEDLRPETQIRWDAFAECLANRVDRHILPFTNDVLIARFDLQDVLLKEMESSSLSEALIWREEGRGGSARFPLKQYRVSALRGRAGSRGDIAELTRRIESQVEQRTSK